MKMKFLAIGLLGAAMAATAVFADDTNTSTQGSAPSMNNSQQATSAADANNAATTPAAPQSGNGNAQMPTQ